MLALIYLAVAIYLGDRICRRFYPFVSVPHRLAAAVIVGLLVSSWISYLAALALFKSALPLVWGNALFFATAIAIFSWPKWKKRISKGQTSTKDARRAS